MEPARQNQGFTDVKIYSKGKNVTSVVVVVVLYQKHGFTSRVNEDQFNPYSVEGLFIK